MPPPYVPATWPDGLGWAAIPLLSAGFGAPASFMYAAVRHRSVALGGAAVLYSAGVVGTFVAMFADDPDLVLLGLLMFILTWSLSSAHALIARPRLYRRAHPREQMNQQALEMARHRRVLREAARKVAAEDPGLARELRIGRPDLQPRVFDDGGLIDVNHAPPQVLSRLPGLTYAMVDRIMGFRAHNGGFVSAEELVVYCDLPPAVLTEFADYALFIR